MNKKHKKDFKIALRNSIPTVSPDWEKWFFDTFGDPKNDLLVFSVYMVLRDSAKNNEWERGFNVSQTRFTKYLDVNKVAPFIKELCKALKEPIPGYSHDPKKPKEGKARELKMSREKAQTLLKQWQSFFIKPQKKTSKYKDLAEMEVTFNHPCRDILNYLNHNALHKFDFTPAFNYVEDQIEVNTLIGNTAEVQKYQQQKLDLLDAEQNHTNGVIYKKCENGYRVFAVGHRSLQGIDKTLRRLITPRHKGYVEVDLQSAHIAIVAGILKLDRVQQLLKNDKCVYTTIANNIGTTRDRIKECLIYTLYGAGKVRVEACLIENKNRRDLAFAELYANRFTGVQAFFTSQSSKLYESLLADPYYAEIKNALNNFDPKQHRDAFDCQLPDVNQKTAMSILCESYEKRLLEPIYNEAYMTSDFKVVLDQHDGLTYYAEDSLRIFNELNRLVKEQADELGIITNLTIKN